MDSRRDPTSLNPGPILPTQRQAAESAFPGVFNLDILILARNEGDVIGPTLRAVASQMQPGDVLHVVADHCTDNTALVAACAGATVHLRSAGREGKGSAIGWWLGRTSHSGNPGVLILDADTLPGPDLIERTRRELINGKRAVQAVVRPLVSANEPISLLSAFSEEKEQAVWDRFSAACGWSVRLRGTGMAFQRSVLEGTARRLRTTIEDAELSLLLAARGIRIDRLAGAVVLDPKAIDSAGAARQRARWLQGQWQLIRCHFRPVIRLALTRPYQWPLLATLLFKPRSLLLPTMAAISGGASLAWALGLVHPAIAFIALTPILMELLTIAIALIVLPDYTLGNLRRWPSYLGMWMASLRLALSSSGGWHRARPRRIDLSTREPRSAEY
jgi:cellulose synthase/poly-beta-1,6-N-acetylglucosamine synthase-like glycosyltransferase